MRMLILLLVGLVGVHGEVLSYDLPSPWSYTCDNNSNPGGHPIPARCVKVEGEGPEDKVGLNACKMTCGEFGMVWPRPVSMVHSKQLIHFLPEDLTFVSNSSNSDAVSNMVNKFSEVFKEYLFMKSPEYAGNFINPFSSKPFLSNSEIKVTVEVESPDVSFTTETDESYSVEIKRVTGKRDMESLIVSVKGKTYYGARHGLETLSQMISFDDNTETLQIYSSAMVEDKPSFRHRGLLIDTSRNYIKKSTLMKIISGMSYDKLNVFHWHITDTHSFPMYSRSVPQLTLYGAYSSRKIYSPQDIKEIVEYAKLRGVRVLPEFDAPAHVGNGWQFGEKEGKGRLAVCVNQEPWQDYCVEPPCGQLNPVNPNVYTTLGKLYEDFFEMFDTDIFHMGGDEVNLNCWNTSQEIRDYLEERGEVGTEDELVELWNVFQTQAAEKVYTAAGKSLPLVLWTSRLTENGEVEKYLNKDDYIIQIWTAGDDAVISELINKGYRVIFSNSDAWYMDCGYSSWVGEGNNWCSPYKGWQIVYENSPRKIYRSQGGNAENEHLILGGEAAMWTEQVDGEAVVHKLWPRASALAERLWSDLETDWKQAEIRMVTHREDLVARGIQADALQPEWCNQNEGLCYLKIN